MTPARSDLRKFGLLVGTILVALAAYGISRQTPPLLCYAAGGAGVVLVALGALTPRVLGPGYLMWMRLAAVLGWINTSILLCIMFFVVLTPIAFIARLLGHDPLGRRRRDKSGSYWCERATEHDEQYYRRQF